VSVILPTLFLVHTLKVCIAIFGQALLKSVDSWSVYNLDKNKIKMKRFAYPPTQFFKQCSWKHRYLYSWPYQKENSNDVNTHDLHGFLPYFSATSPMKYHFLDSHLWGKTTGTCFIYICLLSTSIHKVPVGKTESSECCKKKCK